MISQAKLGWVAGILDLKGRVYFKKNSSRATPQVVLMVESKHAGVIRELSALVGTNPEAMPSRPMKEFMRRSCNEHCPEAHIHVNDDRAMPGMLRFTATGVVLAVIIDALEPMLIQDNGWQELKEEILAGVDMEGRGGTAVMKALRRMETLGWPMPEQITRRLLQRQEALKVLVQGGEDDERETEA